jgi:2-phosphoglycerate kinase
MSTLVNDSTDKSSVPFLRGILTQSLINAGLSFDDAYKLADAVRKDLDDVDEITTEQLRELVASRLAQRKDKSAVELYQTGPGRRPPIQVLDDDDQSAPFSKGLLGRSMEICAFTMEKRYSIAASIERSLLRDGTLEISSDDLARLTYAHLTDVEGEASARRYLQWLQYSRDGRPMVLLIGGTTGSGKSTISAEIAHRLGIVRAQSTDMLREVMRLMFPERLLPALHVSSYLAWQALPEAMLTEEPERRVETGYLAQSREVSIGVEAVLNRASREQISVIVEGVHIYPALQRELADASDAIVIPLMVAVLKRKRLRKQLKGRGTANQARRAERYLKHFDAIWHLQGFLLEEAEKFDIAVISNTETDEAIAQVMDVVSAELSLHYSGRPKDAFGKG